MVHSQASFMFIFCQNGLLVIWDIQNRPKPFHFAIVDEVDSVLIDEGRNPLLISGEVTLGINIWRYLFSSFISLLS